MDSPKPLVVSLVSGYHAPSIELDAILTGKNPTAAARALVDSGATGNLINDTFIRKHWMKTEKLQVPIPIKNADDSESLVRYSVTITMELRDKKGKPHQEEIFLYMTPLGQQDIILGTGWLIKHNPEIDWKKYDLSFTRCPKTCAVQGEFTMNSTHKKANRHKARCQELKKNALPTQLWAEESKETEQQLKGWTYQGLKAARVFFPEAESMYARLLGLPQDPPRYSNISQKLAQEATKDTIKKKPEEIIPAQYHEYLSIFDAKKADRFPSSRPWDHAIDVKPDYQPKDCKIYPLAPKEEKALGEWVKENLEKGYISDSQSPQASPFFFVGKKDGIFDHVKTTST